MYLTIVVIDLLLLLLIINMVCACDKNGSGETKEEDMISEELQERTKGRPRRTWNSMVACSLKEC